MKKTSITRDALRYYNMIGLLNPTINPHNGYKIYSDSDVTQIQFVKSVKQIGFSLNEIKELISKLDQAKCKHQSIIPDLQRHLSEVNEKIKLLNETRKYLETLIKEFKDANCEVLPRAFEISAKQNKATDRVQA